MESKKSSSVYLIKPEGLLYRDAIHRSIRKSGLKVSNSMVIRLPQWAIDTFYKNLPENIREATYLHLLEKHCEVGIVKGVNALEKLVKVCGVATNPNDCKLGTIRRQFSIRVPQDANGVWYWRNAIHRPKNYEELAHDMALVKILLTMR